MTGTAVLLGSILRRDRLRAGLWVAALCGLILYSVLAFQSIYAGTADLAGYAAVIMDSPAARAFSGRGYGLEDPNLGAVIANETLAFLAAGVSLMSIFLVSRNTRAEEEDGRAELLAATRVGRHARSGAALLAVTGLNLAVGLVLAVILIGSGLAALGSVTFGLAVCGCGTLFAALALLSAQLSAHARVGTAIAGGALGVAYLLRALGDIEGSWLSWLSPIGWAQAARPFAVERPGPLLALLGSAVVLAGFALLLERRRDLGGGMIQSRPGPATGRPYMARPFGLPLRLQRVAIVAWLLGTALLGATYGTVATDVEQMIADNPEFADYLAQAGGDLIDSYFVTVLLVVALLATGFAIQSLLRLRAQESSGYAEAVLATGRSRRAWLLGHVSVTAAGIVAILVLGGATIGFGYLLVGGDGARIAELTVAALVWLPAVLSLAAAAWLLIALVPRFTVAAWAILALAFFIGFFGEPLDLPAWLRAISPLSHVPEYPAVPVTFLPPAITAAAAVVLSAAALTAHLRRDIG